MARLVWRKKQNDKQKTSQFGRFLLRIELVFAYSEKRLNDSQNKSKYCCSPKAVGIESADEIIDHEDHQDIDDEGDKSESEPIERRCDQFQK